MDCIHEPGRLTFNCDSCSICFPPPWLRPWSYSLPLWATAKWHFTASLPCCHAGSARSHHMPEVRLRQAPSQGGRGRPHGGSSNNPAFIQYDNVRIVIESELLVAVNNHCFHHSGWNTGLLSTHKVMFSIIIIEEKNKPAGWLGCHNRAIIRLEFPSNYSDSLYFSYAHQLQLCEGSAKSSQRRTSRQVQPQPQAPGQPLLWFKECLMMLHRMWKMSLCRLFLASGWSELTDLANTHRLPSLQPHLAKWHSTQQLSNSTAERLQSTR